MSTGSVLFRLRMCHRNRQALHPLAAHLVVLRLQQIGFLFVFRDREDLEHVWLVPFRRDAANTLHLPDLDLIGVLVVFLFEKEKKEF